MNEQELAELDLAVAKAEGHEKAYIFVNDYPRKLPHVRYVMHCRVDPLDGPYMPSRDWSVAGKLLEKHRLQVRPHHWCDGIPVLWESRSPTADAVDYGETPQIAICKAVVALKASK